MKKYLFIFFLIGIWSCEDAKESQTIKFLKVSEVMNDGGYDVIQSVNDEYFIVGRREGNIYDPSMGMTLHNLRDTYAVRRWAITGDIKMVSDEIGHSSVVMTEKYAKCNLRRLQDDFPSLADRIALRLVPPTEDVYFKNLLQIV